MQTFIFYTTDGEKAIEEIKSSGGQVTQVCTPNIITANLPDDFEITQLQYATADIPEELDAMSRLCVDAWKLDVPEEDIAIKNWDADGFEYPHNRFNDEELTEQFKIYPPTTSSYLIGSVAVGVVIVSGKESSVKFSDVEMNSVLAQVMQGLHRLASFEPLAQATFHLQISVLTVTAPIPTTCPTKEACEWVWRDPALKLMGCSSGLSGVRQYNERLVLSTRTKWAFTAFFTKYPQEHFAYAGSGRTCMEYSNGHWGPGQIFRVFAHEVGHIFGAADEYAKSKCTCDRSGYFKVPNYNCENCTSSFPKVNCLMKNNDWSNLCPWSRGQIGWPFLATMPTSSKTAPSLAAFKDKLYAAAITNDNDSALIISSSDDGIDWEPFRKVGIASKAAPTLFRCDDQLYLAIVANDYANTLLISSSRDGIHWSAFDKMVEASKSAPAFAMLQGQVCTAIIANDYTNNVLVSLASSVKNNAPFQKTGGASQFAPAMAAFKGRFYLAIIAQNTTDAISISSSPDGIHWEPFKLMGGYSGSAPALMVFNNKLYLAYVSSYAKTLMISSSDDGINWTSFTIGKTFGTGVALAAFNDKLCAAAGTEYSKNLLIWNAVRAIL